MSQTQRQEDNAEMLADVKVTSDISTTIFGLPSVIRWQMPDTATTEAPQTAPSTAGQSAPTKPRKPWLDRTGKVNAASIAAPWDRIREAIAAGMSIPKTAKRFAVSLHAVKKRYEREKWFSPNSKQSILIRANVPGGDELSLTPSEPSKSASESRAEVATFVAESTQELAKSGSLIGAKLLHGLLVEAAKPDAKIAPLVDVQDINGAVSGLRKIGGLDKQGPMVSLNLWGASPNVPTRDMGTSSRDTGDNFDGDEE